MSGTNVPPLRGGEEMIHKVFLGGGRSVTTGNLKVITVTQLNAMRSV
jgi:hypothetical protein